jgi:hypothetical protein
VDPAAAGGSAGGARREPPPRILANITQKVDVYSFGILLVSLFVGALDWGPHLPPSTRPEERVRKLLELTIAGRVPAVPPGTQPFWLPLLVQQCTHMDPARRPSFKDICEGIFSDHSGPVSARPAAATAAAVSAAAAAAARAGDSSSWDGGAGSSGSAVEEECGAGVGATARQVHHAVPADTVTSLVITELPTTLSSGIGSGPSHTSSQSARVSGTASSPDGTASGGQSLYSSTTDSGSGTTGSMSHTHSS